MVRRSLFVTIPIGLVLVAYNFLTPGTLGELDFVRYWSASHLLITGNNPYNPDALWELEHNLSPEWISSEQDVVEAWNPPWLMLALAPFAILPFNIARISWQFFTVVLVGWIAALSWNQLATQQKNISLILVIAALILFPATLLHITVGQITILVLLGLWLAWWAIQEKQSFWQDMLAGCGLVLASFKPHIAYLVAIIICIQIIRSRRWGFFVGAAIIGTISLVITSLIVPDLLSIYLNTITSLPYGTLSFSTIGSLFYELTGWSFLRFSAIILIPMIPWLVRRSELQPLTVFNLSLLLSVPLSPYGFAFDQVVLLPSLAQLIYWLWKKVPSGWVRNICWAGLAGVYLLYFWLIALPMITYSWLVLPVLCLFALWFICWRISHATD